MIGQINRETDRYIDDIPGKKTATWQLVASVYGNKAAKNTFNCQNQFHQNGMCHFLVAGVIDIFFSSMPSVRPSSSPVKKVISMNTTYPSTEQFLSPSEEALN